MVKYIIKKDSIENSLDYFEFSEYDRFLTTRMEDGKETYNGIASGYAIKNGEVSIPREEYSLWEDAVFAYINKHNDDVVKGNQSSIQFKITDIDANACCAYEEYLSGKLIKTGTGWCRDLKSDAEKKAWREAVKLYKKNNGIPTPTSTIASHAKAIRTAAADLDAGLGSFFDLTPPLIEAALAKLLTDPCNFISDITKAIKVAISRINGIPSPVELSNYYSKLIKDNIQTTIDNRINAVSEVSTAVLSPCLDKIVDISPQLQQLDAEYEEFKKTHASDIGLLYRSVDQEIKIEPYTYSFGEYEETEFDGVSVNDIGNFEYTGDDKFTTTSYKEVEPNLIAKGGLCRASRPNTNIPRQIYTNINDALKNCWVPLRLAWNEYCTKKGWNSTWNITSGYRPTSGKATSAHNVGWAIDVQPHYKTQEEKREKVLVLGEFIYNYLRKNRNIKVDQLIVEYESRYSIWVHIGYKRPNTGEQRGQYWPDYNAKGSHGTMKKI